MPRGTPTSCVQFRGVQYVRKLEQLASPPSDPRTCRHPHKQPRTPQQPSPFPLPRPRPWQPRTCFSSLRVCLFWSTHRDGITRQVALFTGLLRLARCFQGGPAPYHVSALRSFRDRTTSLCTEASRVPYPPSRLMPTWSFEGQDTDEKWQGRCSRAALPGVFGGSGHNCAPSERTVPQTSTEEVAYVVAMCVLKSCPHNPHVGLR